MSASAKPLRRFRIIAALAVIAAIKTFGLARAEDPAARCDQLAASPQDTQRPAGVSGVELGDIDVKAALSACESAVLANPSSAHLRFQLGRVNQMAGNIESATSAYLTAAEAGHLIAMSNVGALLEDSQPEVAVGWYQKAADLGSALGQYNRAVAYEHGVGGSVDIVKALELYEKAKAQGDSYAAYNIAVIFDEARTGTRDMAKAVEYYQFAADHGNINALFNLAYTFEKGDGSAINKPAALALYEKAANLGDEEAADAVIRLKGEGK